MQNVRDQLTVRKERAILVGAIFRVKGKTDYRSGDNLVELTALAETAGAVVVDRFQQKLHRIHPATYIGKGKAGMLLERVERFKADVIIFDNDLSPGQIRELEKVTEVKVIDRSELILDIFATRAKTHQARLQVELAQLQYTYPRLTRMWSHLDTVAGAGGAGAVGAVGGIGTRGTGEKQLEIDRRLAGKRITELKRNLAKIDDRRLREIDSRKGVYKICLVGYTNAGKSTVMNALTDAGVFVAGRLFATLDTRTRKWAIQTGAEVLLSDTVGFVNHLPHHLVASFKATLEEAVNADLLIHVVDASNERVFEQIDSVNNVLDEIGCRKKETLMLLNKIDIVQKLSVLESVQTVYRDAICISAKTGMNLDNVARTVLEKCTGGEVVVRVSCSIADGKVQNFLRANGTILHEDYSDNLAIIEVRLGKVKLDLLRRLKPEKIEIL